MQRVVVIRNYDLLDAELLVDRSSTYRCMVWEPGFRAVVLGQSNELEDSVHMDAVTADGVPVYKRPSGGESVVLSPNTLVISILKRGDRFQSPRLYFKAYNESIIGALGSLGIKNLGSKGISDICIGDRKILGSSIYRSKDLVLYHAVLNRAESTDIFERYLKHPVREPGYRQSRSHSDFVTSLVKQGYQLTGNTLREKISSVINKKFCGGARGAAPWHGEPIKKNPPGCRRQ